MVILREGKVREASILAGLDLGTKFGASQVIDIDMSVDSCGDTEGLGFAEADCLNRVLVIPEEASDLASLVVAEINLTGEISRYKQRALMMLCKDVDLGVVEDLA